MRKILCGVVAAAMLITAPAASAAVVPAHQVFADAVNDGDPGSPDFTPPWQDLVAGYISETADAIEFTWQVVDLPDALTTSSAAFHWEFAFADANAADFVPCTEEGNRCFSLRADVNLQGGTSGALESNCGGSPVVECELLDSNITVSYDVDANTITASVPRADLRNPADGELLFEVELFRGIAAFQKLGVPSTGVQRPDGLPEEVPNRGTSFVCSCVMDTADLDAGWYVLGTNKV